MDAARFRKIISIIPECYKKLKRNGTERNAGTGGKMAKKANERQISVILTEENFNKMKDVTKNMCMSRTDFINAACAEIPVIGLAETRGILEEFVKIRMALETGTLSEVDRKAGEEACRCLNSLTEQISSLRI